MSSVKSDFRISPFGPDDSKEVHKLTSEIAWPHTLEDLRFALSICSGYGARDKETGALVGLCCTWQFGDAVSSLGLLVVSPAAGGRGLGRALLRRCLSDQSDRTILLHATAPAVGLYVSEGFERAGWIRQVQGQVTTDFAPSDHDPLPNIRPLSTDIHDELLELDRAATGLDRSIVLMPILRDDRTSGLVHVDEGGTCGYAFCRPFGRGVVIGPVVACSESGAKCLVTNLLADLKGEFVRLDLTNHGFDTSWFADIGLIEVDRVEVMTRGPMPEIGAPAKKFALIGHAFG